jgi:hypothetical protein
MAGAAAVIEPPLGLEWRQLEAHDFSESADWLEPRAAAGTEIIDKFGPGRGAVQARLAAYAFEVGHQGRFLSVSQTSIHDRYI